MLLELLRFKLATDLLSVFLSFEGLVALLSVLEGAHIRGTTRGGSSEREGRKRALVGFERGTAWTRRRRIVR